MQHASSPRRRKTGFCRINPSSLPLFLVVFVFAGSCSGISMTNPLFDDDMLLNEKEEKQAIRHLRRRRSRHRRFSSRASPRSRCTSTHHQTGAEVLRPHPKDRPPILEEDGRYHQREFRQLRLLPLRRRLPLWSDSSLINRMKHCFAPFDG